MAAIPNFERAFVEPRKVLEYLLNAGHPKGGPKARFFLANGFSSETLPAALMAHAFGAEATVTSTPFGVLYVVDRPLDMPSGRPRQVRAVWEVRLGETFPRLVTAYPVE